MGNALISNLQIYNNFIYLVYNLQAFVAKNVIYIYTTFWPLLSTFYYQNKYNPLIGILPPQIDNRFTYSEYTYDKMVP